MRPLLAALACLAALPGCSAPGAEAGHAFDGDLDDRLVKAGESLGSSGSGPPRVATRFFTDEASWRAAWAPGQSEPEPVDFARQVVLELRWGPLPSTGHRVVPGDAAWSAAEGYSLPAQLLRPGPGCAVGGAFTQAYAWVALDRVGDVAQDTPVRVAGTEAAGPPCSMAP